MQIYDGEQFHRGRAPGCLAELAEASAADTAGAGTPLSASSAGERNSQAISGTMRLSRWRA